MKKILVVAAHPDDEILGCAGTVAKLVKDGSQVFVLILGEGITSRDEERDRRKREKEIEELKKEAKKANRILGVKKVFFFEFPDNRFDTIPLIDIAKAIEKTKKEIMPDIIFTHYEKDLNIDHQITYKAVIIATRPVKRGSVKEIYSFETPSSTEWSFPLSFLPDTFFDISKTIDIKLRALKKYKSELRQYPHPRSIKGIELIAKHWGMKLGLKYAEVFKTIRTIK